MKLEYTVKQNDNYTNLKELLKAYFNISDRLLLKLKKSSCILVNSSSPLHISQDLKPGDYVQVVLDFEEDNSNIVPMQMNLDIIYEDEYYLVINKAPNMPVHPSMLHYDNSLSNGIRYYFDSIGLKRKIRPVNRLDKDTSGIVIFAKNEYIQNCLVYQMQTKEFKKEYIAICEGIFKKKNGTIELPIARKEGSIIERCIDKNGDTAITHYQVLKEIDNKISVVKCLLETGRTHQIRVHLSAIGHPILGDTLYGSSKNKQAEAPRQLLHAYKTSFTHPITKKEVFYIANIPDDIFKYSGSIVI